MEDGLQDEWVKQKISIEATVEIIQGEQIQRQIQEISVRTEQRVRELSMNCQFLVN